MADSCEVPATQIMSTQVMDDEDNENEVVEKESWGKLMSLCAKYKSVDLQGEVIMGRKRTCTHIYENPYVSGTHCKFFKQDGEVFVMDLSTNGTFVNRSHVGKDKMVCLKDGDEVWLVSPQLSKDKSDDVVAFVFHSPGAKVPSRTKQKQENKLEDMYQVDQEIGKGTYSEVKIGREKTTGKKVAIKVIEKRRIMKSKRGDSSMRDEITIVSNVQHPNIVKVEEETHFYLVMELAPGGDLFDYIDKRGRVDETNSRRIMKQLFEAIQYLHSQNIVHRDLKPENFLMMSQEDDAAIKISDFGVSRVTSSMQTMQTLCGTPAYVAPEILAVENGNGNLSGYGSKCDMWSLGVILYALLSGTAPFYPDGMNRPPVNVQVMKGMYDFPASQWSSINPLAVDLIKKLLVVEPSKRLNATEALEHPWIGGKNIQPPAPRVKRPNGASPTVAKSGEEDNEKLLRVGSPDKSEATCVTEVPKDDTPQKTDPKEPATKRRKKDQASGSKGTPSPQPATRRSPRKR